MNAALKQEESDSTPAVETQTTTALALVTQSITEINAFETGIAELEHQYKGVVFEVGTTAGMDDACKARLIIRKPRYAIQNLQKQAKATLNGLKDGIDEQAEGYIARIAAVEGPVHEQIANEEARKKAEKEAKRVAEQARISAIQESIDDIRDSVALVVGKSVADIELMIADLVALPIDDSFAEFKERAEAVKDATLTRLRMVHTAAVNTEAEQKRLEEVRANLAREKAEQDAAAAKERARIAEEQRVAREAAAAEAARQAKGLREQREAQEAENARVRAEQEERARVERERLAEESRRLEAQRLKQEEEERERQIARTTQEAREREIAAREAALISREMVAPASHSSETADEPIVTISGDPFATLETAATAEISVATEKAPRPSDAAIVEILMRAFSVERDTIVDWLWDMDLTALVHGAPVGQDEAVPV